MSNQENQDLYAQLGRLPAQITRYYDAYFSELRKELERLDLFSEAVPDFLKGYKRVLTIAGTDGIVVAHYPVALEITWSDRGSGEVLIRFPSEPNAEEDRYEFLAYRYVSASELVTLVSGGEDADIEISADVSWGVKGFDQPQVKIDLDTGRLAWQAPWTRLLCADFNHLFYFQDTERAKRAAREDVAPFVRGLERKELDEVRAPGDIEEAGVKTGDRGVVLEVFEHPIPALIVEYADLLGQTKALITYSTDLEEIRDVFVDRDFLENRESNLEEDDTLQEGTLDFPADESVTPGQLAPA
jgi:hypothetical protein